MAIWLFSYGEIAKLVVLVTVAIYLYVRYHYGYWRRKGVFSPAATFPGGHLNTVLMGKEHIALKLKTLYDSYKCHPYVGLFVMFRRAILVNDLDIIKNIIVKDFQYFVNHGLAVSKESDPINNHLFNMEGIEWKELRAKLTSTFTSSKMKVMFDLMLKVAEDLEVHLTRELKTGKPIDFKDTFTKYTTNVIGSCAFGLEINSFIDPSTQFRMMGMKVFKQNFLKNLRELASLVAPSMIKTFKIKILLDEVTEFFVKTIDETIRYREENDITRNDFLHLLMQLNKKALAKGGEKVMTLEELTAQVYIFFLGGYETSSSAASYALFELAKNPEVQKRVQQEIDEVTDKYGGKITYESIHEMNYLTGVIDESLRMYPPIPFLIRECEKDYLIPNHKDVIPKGTLVLIPTYAIQRDPEIHLDPLTFDPERSTKINKIERHAMSHLPFGEGPRVCIGQRFGLMSTRLALIKTLSKFDVSLCEETKMPIVFDKKGFVLQLEESQYLRITER